MTGESQKDEEFGERSNGESEDESVEIEVFPFGFGKVPWFRAVERWVFQVERRGEEEAPEADRDEEEEGREMGC